MIEGLTEEQELVWKALSATTLIDQVRISKLRGEPTPQLCESMVKIATRLVKRPNFVNYPYQEDMIQEAIAQMLKLWRIIDLEKCENGSASVYSFLVIIAQNSFTHFIHNERRWKMIKEIAEDQNQ